MWYYQSKKDVARLSISLQSLPNDILPEALMSTTWRSVVKVWYGTENVFSESIVRWSYRCRHKKRIIKRVQLPLETPDGLNECWSMDFMSDTLTDGRKLRVFHILDDCNREALAVEAGLSYPAWALVETLENLKKEIGVPKYIRCGNGQEFISRTFTNWCNKNFIEIKYIQPGRPMQNGYIERLNRHYREDILDAYYFGDIHQLQNWVINGGWTITTTIHINH